MDFFWGLFKKSRPLRGLCLLVLASFTVQLAPHGQGVTLEFRVVANAHADADPCAKGKVEEKSKEAAKDPCHMAKVADFAAAMGIATAALYVAATTVCAIACVWKSNVDVDDKDVTAKAAIVASTTSACNGLVVPVAVAACLASDVPPTTAALVAAQTKLAADTVTYGNWITACTGVGIGAQAGDIAAGVATGLYAQDVIQALQSTLQSIGGIGMGMAMGGGIGAPTEMTEVSKVDPKTGKETAKDKRKDIKCPQAYLPHAINAVLRGATSGIAMAMAAKQRKLKADLVGSEKIGTSSSALTAANGNAGTGGTAGEATIKSASINRGGTTTPGKPTAEKVVQNASAASDGAAQLLKKFEETTGHSSEELAQRLIDGEKPLEAAYNMANGQISGETAATLSALQEHEDELVAAVGDKVKDPLADSMYESGKRNMGGGAKDDGMEGLGEMMSQMMSQFQPKAKDTGPQGPKGVGFGQAKKIETKDGFHTPEKSIFDIVFSRYQIVAPSFLAGETVTNRQPAASLIPVNPYLRAPGSK